MKPLGRHREPEDADTFSLLYASEYPAMVRVAALLVGSASLAEEVVQEAAIAVRERWESLERPGAYFRTTVVNGCAAALRRREIERRFVGQDVTHPETQVLSEDLLDLQNALSALTERQRTVVVLRYFVDVHDDEIAALMNIQPSTVRSLTRRALASLRKELE